MDRNLLLAFVLSFLVLYTWSSWQQSVHPKPVPAAEQGIEGTEAGPAVADMESTPESAAEHSRYADLPAGSEAPPPVVPRSMEAPQAPLEPAQYIEIERPLYEAVLSTRGGTLESWELKSYTDEHGEPVRLVERAEGPDRVGSTPFPELGLGDLGSASWQVESQDQNEIVFALDRGGVNLQKTWRFSEDGYGFRLRLDIENVGDASVSPRFLVDWPARVRKEPDFKEQAFALLHSGKVQRTPLAGLGSRGLIGTLTGREPEDHFDFPGEIDWAGVQTTYFVAALLPDNPTQASARIAVLERSKQGALELFFDPVDLPPGQRLTREFRGYIGPKEMERLEAIGGGLEKSIDLGWAWFTPMTRGFGWLLQALYTVIPNYGLAIIVLTILVRGVTAPLTIKQMRSMERMRRVQPRMKEIQEKYADDRQKQSEEVMRLYRAEKVNPLGGCFPMLLQLPVFIGLFYALRSSIQLRHAPFFGWITDLSAPEVLFMLPGLDIPVRVLPLIMGATMFFQQKITPMQTPDPTQARMMQTIMPLMMTVLFYQFASGLVLYWMMSNVAAILHQLWIGRKMGPTPAAESGSPTPKAA